MLLKALWIFGALFFTYAVVMQYNDPDPLVWMSLYGIVAIANVAALAGRLSPRWIAVATLPHLVYGLMLSPYLLRTSLHAFQTMGMKNDLEELVRESWGTVVCVLWMTGLFFYARHLAVRKSSEAIA
ncbi:MAG TPA: transmembrane 220 family protein [Povalibacter sp.]|uniref:transmembrane 220 family protein n=1 Tax=Povalibacter sp. TaxID=1962978 RepID=UPI002B8FF10A|nr:transmembrane 220 family protein [Povalibacter sp.]HMN43057.1 transmembrane 220 family protein [Povalibacter sp.]